MDFVIIDGDCRNTWSLSELERLLDASHDAIWFCESAVLREHNYNAASAAQTAIDVPFEKAVLVTKLQSGVMNYHQKMIHNTGCRRWLIVIVGRTNEIYKEQYCNAFDSMLGDSVRYEIVFDGSPELKIAREIKKEVVDDRLFCVIATRSDAQFAENVQKILQSAYPDWRFECHVGMEADSYRHADIILVVGRTEEDYAVPPAKENASRVRIWLDVPFGFKTQKPDIIVHMNRSGWNLSSQRIRCSCLANEMLLQELNHGEISREALCTDDRFVMWDRYGLPLPAHAYESPEQAETFLRGQCCFPDLLGTRKQEENLE